MEFKSLRGTHYGSIKCDSNHFRLNNDDKNIIKVPLNIVTKAVVDLDKKNVRIEIEEDKNNDFSLCEIQFYVPEVGQLEELKDKLKNIGDAEQSDEEVLVQMHDLSFNIPRGKFALELSAKAIKFLGPSNTYNTDFKNIDRAFLLPKENGKQTEFYFVIQFKQPLSQGKTTKYNFFVLTLSSDKKPLVILNSPQIKETSGKEVDIDIEKEQSYEIFPKLFKTITNLNIIIPSNEFKCSTGESGIRCSINGNEGILYFFNKSLLFVLKPAIYLKFEDLSKVEFQRVSAEYKLSKNFDILLMTDKIVKGKDSHICLAGIDKLDLPAIQEFLIKKEVKIEEEEIEKVEGESEYEEEEEEGGKKEGKEKRRGGGRRKEGGGGGRGGGGGGGGGEKGKKEEEEEDEDEEDDEDFNPDDVEEDEEEEQNEEEDEGN